MDYFWYFLGYGFGGYLFEKAFARVTHSRHQVRKGFLLAPICPVYGLAMCTILALGIGTIEHLWEMVLVGGAVATAVEYAVHLLYETVFGVKFWDYSGSKMDVNGRICLPFSVAWGLLSAAALKWVQPIFARLAAGIPFEVTALVLLCLGIDALWSAGVLLRWGDIELLAPSALRAKRRMA